jgi:mannose-6-phosphate isomerase-like protein (cupin superfamily)
LTLDELSKKSNVSVSLLSMIERNKSVPTVRTLERTVDALGTTVSNLFMDIEDTKREDIKSTRVTVLKKKKRKKLILGPERGKAFYELLTPDYRQNLEIVYIHFPVGKNKGEFISHEGEECGIILEGRLKAYIGERIFILEDGDCIYFDSSMPHRWENIGEVEVRAFWINTPATF